MIAPTALHGLTIAHRRHSTGGMNEKVAVEIAALVESLPTRLAHKGLLARVNSHMHTHIAARAKRARTHGAGIGLFVAMYT